MVSLTWENNESDAWPLNQCTTHMVSVGFALLFKDCS